MTCDVPVPLVRRAFYAVFVVLPKSEKRRHRRHNLVRVLDCLMVTCMLFVIGNEVYISYKSFGDFPLGFILTSATGTLCSVGVRIALVTKSDEVVSAIHQIARSHKLASHKKRDDALILIAAFCCCWIVPGLMTFNVVRTMMSENGDLIIQEATFCGWYSDAWWLTCLAFFINCVNLQQVYALPGFCAILCAYTSKLLSRAMKKAQRRIRVVKDLRQLVLCYMDLDQKLSHSLGTVNTALSPMLLMLYCYFMSCIFIVITMVIQIWPKHAIVDELIYHLTVFVLSLSAFYAMSMQGVNVHRVALEIKKAIYASCLKRSSPIGEEDEDIRFLLLTMIDGFEIKTQISVLDMFSLNQTFILQTTGAILSYGIIIAQLGNEK